jgi:hypothetical protein
LPIKKSNINPSEITPPDRAQHIQKHYITYTPPQPDLHSSETDDSDANSSSDEDDENESNVNDVDKDKDDDLDVDYNDGDDDYEYDDDDDDDDDDSKDEPASPVHVHRRTSIIIRHADDFEDLTIEEVDEDDMAYDSDTSVIHPSHLSEATSGVGHEQENNIDADADADADADNSNLDSSSDDNDSSSDDDSSSGDDSSDDDSASASDASNSSLTINFQGLSCGNASSRALQRHARVLDAAYQERRARRQRRWRRGGNKKRRHDRSCGPGADGGEHDDIVPLDDDGMQLGEGSGTVADRRLRRRTDEPVSRPRISQLFDRPVPGLEEVVVVVLEDEDEGDPDEVMPPAWMFSSSVMEIDGAEGVEGSRSQSSRRVAN